MRVENLQEATKILQANSSIRLQGADGPFATVQVSEVRDHEVGGIYAVVYIGKKTYRMALAHPGKAADISCEYSYFELYEIDADRDRVDWCPVPDYFIYLPNVARDKVVELLMDGSSKLTYRAPAGPPKMTGEALRAFLHTRKMLKPIIQLMLPAELGNSAQVDSITLDRATGVFTATCSYVTPDGGLSACKIILMSQHCTYTSWCFFSNDMKMETGNIGGLLVPRPDQLPIITAESNYELTTAFVRFCLAMYGAMSSCYTLSESGFNFSE